MRSALTLSGETTPHVTPAPLAIPVLLGFITKLPENILKTVRNLQKYEEKTPSPQKKKTVSYYDIGPARGDGLTDYAKPVWRR